MHTRTHTHVHTHAHTRAHKTTSLHYLCIANVAWFLHMIYNLLAIHIHAAACPSFNINYPPMRALCLGDTITYTCALNSNSTSITTQWTGSSGFQCSNLGSDPNTIQLTQSKTGSLNNVSVSCGSLSAVMTNISGTCYTSVLTIPTPQYFNGTTVICRDGNTSTVIGNDALNIQLACKYCSHTVLLGHVII